MIKKDFTKYEVEWPEWQTLLADKFIPLMNDKSRVMIAWGGRQSGKSYSISLKVVYLMLTSKFFRGVLVRNTYESISNSSYRAIQDCIYKLGFEELFTFKQQPLRIECKNGNSLLAKGVDGNPQALKSVSNLSFCWIEEDIIAEEAWLSINLSMRTLQADYLQTIVTINPQIEGQNFEENWFYKRYFEQHQGEYTFRDISPIKVGTNKDGTDKIVDLEYYCHHSNYLDNLINLNPIAVAELLHKKETNPEEYIRSALGEWCNQTTTGLFYKKFNRAKHVSETAVYDKELPLHISYDFNVAPFCSGVVFQISGNAITIIDEIATVSPNNTATGVSREFARRFLHHQNSVFIYGDPSGKSRSSIDVEEYNHYVAIAQTLEMFNPQLRLLDKHPPVAKRGEFINEIFDKGYDGITITVNPNCKHLNNDLSFQKEKADGSKNKERITRKGESYERLGHMSDALDYALCKAFEDSFYQFQYGTKDLARMFIPRRMNERFKY